jgi:hypothetical protein
MLQAERGSGVTFQWFPGRPFVILSFSIILGMFFWAFFLERYQKFRKDILFDIIVLGLLTLTPSISCHHRAPITKSSS